MYTFDTVTTAYSMNPYKLLHTNVTDLPKKGSKSYKSITYENYRIGKQDISNTMLSKCLSWFNKKAPLSTLHEKSRCRQYLNSKTRDKKGIELTTSEYMVWSNPSKRSAFIRSKISKNEFIPVEIGLNKNYEISKIAFVLKSIGNNDNSSIFTTKGRVIYICMGIDHGIKTWYITNGYKNRTNYKSKNGIKYLTSEQVKKLFSL